MILFYNRTNDIQVMRTKNCGLGVDDIGCLRQPDTGQSQPNWIWDFGDLWWERIEDFSSTEKHCIIGMLDKLNGVDYRNQDTMLARWEELTGPKGATISDQQHRAMLRLDP